MFFSNRKIIGLEFNDYYVEVVQLSYNGELQSLEAYNRMIIPSEIIIDGEIVRYDMLKELVLELFREAVPIPISGHDVATILPSNKIFTHIFSFPAALTKGEVAGALQFEIEKIIPYPLDDIYYDFRIIDSPTVNTVGAEQKVLFSCVEKGVADRYQSLLRSLGLNSFLFGVVPDALKQSLRSQLPLDKDILVIEADTLSVNYLVLSKGIIKYFYSSNEGGRKLIQRISQFSGLSEDEVLEKKEKFNLQDLNCEDLINSFYKGLFSRGANIIDEKVKNGLIGGVDLVLLTGKFLDVRQSHVVAREVFAKYKVEIGDPKLGISIQLMGKDFENKEMQLVPYSIFFVHAIGAAVCQMLSGSSLNLLPTSLKLMFVDKKKSLWISSVAAVMSILSLLISGLILFDFQTLNYSRANLELEKSSIEKVLYGLRYQEIRDKIISFNEEVAVLQGVDMKLYSSPSILKQIYDLAPDGVEITGMGLNDDSLVLDVRGIAVNRDILLDLQKLLQNLDFVEQVVAPISNFDEKEKISFLFQLKLNFSKLQKYGSSEY